MMICLSLKYFLTTPNASVTLLISGPVKGVTLLERIIPLEAPNINHVAKITNLTSLLFLNKKAAKLQMKIIIEL